MAMDMETDANDTPSSSRLCVKNLPKYAEDKRLREHFGARGELTDVKVLRTRDGQSRQMAFIGFKSEADAKAALKYFNNTFIDTFRITVEFARKYGDQGIPRPWSRHSDGSSARDRAQAAAKGPLVVDGGAEERSAAEQKRKKKGGAAGALAEDDPKLAEFLQLMAPRSKAKTWANDDALPPPPPLPGPQPDPAGTARAGVGIDVGSDTEDEYQDVDEVARGRAEAAAGRLGISGGGGGGSDSDGASDDGGGPVDSDDDEDGGGGGSGPATADARDDEVSDLEYLRSKMVARKWSDSEDEDEDEGRGAGGRGSGARGGRAGASGGAVSGAAGLQPKRVAGREPAKAHADPGVDAGADVGVEMDASARSDVARADAGEGAPRAAPIEVVAEADDDEGASVAESGRLFVRNLAYTATEADLSELFGSYGDLTEVHLVLDR
mmetsp:Transcript_8890/g.26983  ORF Transcript_8890/g.26983 Transcript_8890/m.26983 type:complete len:438 (-) Transcript_8890:12-1325(-)